jgi:hypothetical protein
MHLHVDSLMILRSSDHIPKRRSPMQMLNSGMCGGQIVHAPYPRPETMSPRLVHLLDEFVDLVLSVA